MSIFKCQIKNSSRGFTLPELIVSVVVFATLAMLVTISVVNVKQKTSLQTSLEVLIGDIRQQQLKAMIGDTEGRGLREDFGIHPMTNSYVLFHGSSYVPGQPGNFTVQLGDNVVFTAASDFIFRQVSGELSGGATSLTLYEDSTKISKTIRLNQLGVVIAVD